MTYNCSATFTKTACDICSTNPATTVTTGATPVVTGTTGAYQTCPSWTTTDDDYIYKQEEWGGNGYKASSYEWVGNHNMNIGALTTACTWLSQCKGNKACIHQCPVALAIAYNESAYSPNAQSSDGIGRGLFQIGGRAATSSCRGFKGPQCGGKGTGGLSKANDKGCTAYNPLKNTEWTIKFSTNGMNFLPTGASWSSCGTDGTPLALNESGFNKATAISRCQQAVKALSQNYIYPSSDKYNWSCKNGPLIMEIHRVNIKL